MDKIVCRMMVNSCKIVSNIIDELREFIKPGISELEIDYFCRDRMVFYNCQSAALGYKGFPAHVCVSTNNVICHGIPTNRILQDGDIVSVDVAIKKDGFFGDTCSTYLVGNVSKARQKVMDVAFESMWETINHIKQGVTTGTLGFIMQKTAAKHGMDTVREFAGHGVGRNFHEDPSIPFYGQPYQGCPLRAGQHITIEPMIVHKNQKLIILEDGWTALGEKDSAQFEHTILVTKTGYEVLTFNSLDKIRGKEPVKI